MADASLTWLGHASFRIDSPGGKRVYVDPWLDGNPRCPEAELEPERCDVVAVTHGHGDHTSGAPGLCRRFSAPVIAMLELAQWLSGQGIENTIGMNKGGTVEVEGIRFTMTNAFHSSSAEGENGAAVYTGEPAGFVIELETGTKLYFAGDTCVFSDMQLIGRLYAPDVAVLPIGDFYTMGPAEAALALELLGSPRCVPCHYGTFPALTGTPDELRRLAAGVEIVSIEPGQTVPL
jgi:L-ascorbate metabolism protein UlaG (beta-lactamase superfamily)